MSRTGRRYLTILVALLCIAAAAVASYARFIEPFWLEVTRHTVVAPVRRPLKIAHLTDLHTGGLGRRERMLLEEIGAERPDIIFITGDSVDVSRNYEPYRGFLTRLEAPLGVWAVRGNHEIWQPLSDEPAFYRGAGVNFLVNEARQAREDLWVMGFDDLYAGNPNLEQGLRGVPRGVFTIALFHSPAYFDRVAGHCDMALAGHTHGGQIAFPMVGPVWLPPESGGFVSGWYTANGSSLYVSRGIGTSFIEVRFLSRPELAIITVVPSERESVRNKTPSTECGLRNC